MHRVFVVDDEQDIVDILVDYLAAESFEVTGSCDPAHAQEAIAAAQPEIVLLDIMMPNVDGYEVARRMKADLRTASIPIIFLTGKERQDDDMRFSRSSGDLFIRKPIPLPELKESVLFMIENQPTTGQ